MDKAMEFLGGVILIFATLAALCMFFIVGFSIYMHAHDCPVNYDRCGIFPIGGESR